MTRLTICNKQAFSISRLQSLAQISDAGHRLGEAGADQVSSFSRSSGVSALISNSGLPAAAAASNVLRRPIVEIGADAAQIGFVQRCGALGGTLQPATGPLFSASNAEFHSKRVWRDPFVGPRSFETREKPALTGRRRAQVGPATPASSTISLASGFRPALQPSRKIREQRRPGQTRAGARDCKSPSMACDERSVVLSGRRRFRSAQPTFRQILRRSLSLTVNCLPRAPCRWSQKLFRRRLAQTTPIAFTGRSLASVIDAARSPHRAAQPSACQEEAEQQRYRHRERWQRQVMNATSLR